MILYVSRGLLSSLTDAREVMDVVSRYNARTGHKVIINTYAVIDGEFVGGHLFDLLSVFPLVPVEVPCHFLKILTFGCCCFDGGHFWRVTIVAHIDELMK